MAERRASNSGSTDTNRLYVKETSCGGSNWVDGLSGFTHPLVNKRCKFRGGSDRPISLLHIELLLAIVEK
jgi:hypothetical protein